MTDESSQWPAWFYGPDGAKEVFNNEDEVPAGWQDHPSKVGGEKRAKKDEQVTDESPYRTWDDAKVITELKIRKIEFGERWPRQKLEALLLTDDKKGK